MHEALNNKILSTSNSLHMHSWSCTATQWMIASPWLTDTNQASISELVRLAVEELSFQDLAYQEILQELTGPGDVIMAYPWCAHVQRWGQSKTQEVGREVNALPCDQQDLQQVRRLARRCLQVCSWANQRCSGHHVNCSDVKEILVKQNRSTCSGMCTDLLSFHSAQGSRNSCALRR